MSFLRTVAPFFHQADVWAVLLRHFHFWQVMVIHSADVDGYSLLNRLQTQFQSNDDEGEQREIKVSIRFPCIRSISSIQIREQQRQPIFFDPSLSISISKQLSRYRWKTGNGIGREGNRRPALVRGNDGQCRLRIISAHGNRDRLTR